MFPNLLHEPLLYAFPFFLLAELGEVLFLKYRESHHPEPSNKYAGFNRVDSTVNISMFAISTVTSSIFRILSLIGYVLIYEYLALWHLSSSSMWTWIGVLLAVDLTWYLYHRFSHRVRLAWAGHQVHHSSVYFNLTTAARQKWNQWIEVLIWIPFPLLGVPPWMIYLCFSLNLIWQFFLHTEAVEKLWRPIEYIFNTPSHHRVHHGSDPLYLDKNYGGVLILWDRWFGTFQQETFRPTYGLTKPVTTQNIFRLQFGEYQAIFRDMRTSTNWKTRLGYLFGPPGWEPPTKARS